jgi:hypothetical protein
MNDIVDSSPENRIKELLLVGIKKTFLVIVAFITYWQLYEYVSESPVITISIEHSKKDNGNYRTLVSVKNGSESISSDDIVSPVKIDFNDTIIN